MTQFTDLSPHTWTTWFGKWPSCRKRKFWTVVERGTCWTYSIHLGYLRFFVVFHRYISNNSDVVNQNKPSKPVRGSVFLNLHVKSLVNGFFIQRLADFYEKSIPYLCSQIESLQVEGKASIEHNLYLARKFLLQIYNALLHSTSIKVLLSQRYFSYCNFEKEKHLMSLLTFILQ